jgi:hypothetical protein
MAGTRAKMQPPGSMPWLKNEREEANRFLAEEVEEFSFNVRNELDWLQEHMSDIFSNSNL